jgi:Na+/H+-dicarboxylate symporter/ABC-type amino acid transport substrate-binding protein
MTFSSKVLVGLIGGIATGLFLGDLVAPLQIVADGFVKLLQMTVLPYVTISIITSVGTLSYDEARRLGLRVGLVLGGLWIVAFAFALLFPLVFPAAENATFFSSALLQRREPFDFVGLYIPSNPFHSLANNVVPAVVLFSLIVGIALIGIERKEGLLDVLGIARQAVTRATQFVTRLTPIGIFAIAAAAAGTLDLDELGRIQVYLLTYVAMALLISLWVLPGLVSALTPIRFGDVVKSTRDSLITAFIAGDLFIVLPALTESCKEILRRYHITDDRTGSLPEAIVPASFNFPHVGKLLSISFVLFAGWFSDATVPVSEYPRLVLTGLLTLFGSVNAAVPFLLDLFRVPADTFQLFVATSVVNARFGTLVAAVHTITIALIGASAVVGAVRFQPARLARFALVTLLLAAGTVAGLRTLFATVLRQHFAGAQIVSNMRPLYPAGTVPIRAAAEATPPSPGQTVLDAIRARAALRVCVATDRMPYGYENGRGELVGLDIEMAHRLARDLGVALDLVRFDVARLADLLDGGSCDIAMAGTAVTPLRASRMLFSQPYLDETLAFVVKDHLREQFTSWASIRALGPMRVGVPDVPYYIAVLKDRAPRLTLQVLDLRENPLDARHGLDAVVLPAERGSILTLVEPKFTVVVPEPDIIRVPIAYGLARHDQAWASFVNTWIELKRRDGTLDALYRHWILGADAIPRPPRWSVLRDVLHWVE